MGNATIARKCVIPAIQKSGIGRVIALASRSPIAAEPTARRFDIPTIYGKYEDLLADREIDAVYIPLPNHMHLPWTLKSLLAGKHVLCEKPLALNSEEAKAMAEASRQADRLLMEAFMYRFHPRSLRIKEMVSGGEVGTPKLLRAAFCFHMDPDILDRGNNFRLRPDMGGGVLLDTGCYCVSVVRWLLEKEPSRVQAQAVYHPGGVDCQVAATLFFPEEVFATVEISFMATLQQTYTIIGSEAAVELPHDAFIPWEKKASYVVRKRDEESGRQFTVEGVDEYQLMVTCFSEAVLGRKALPFSTMDSIKNMQVLDALALAAKTGNRVDLSK